MLYEELKSLAFEYELSKVKPEDYSYITENLKFPLYDWQKTAIENFLLNEKIRKAKTGKGETLPPNHLMFNMATGSGKTLVMAALILYYYKQGYRNFIFFVNQNAILGKTQANFIDNTHNKYLFSENIVIDGVRVKILEVEPINFLLRSVREQKGIIYSFASWLKISPVKIQIKVLTKKADISQPQKYNLRPSQFCEPTPSNSVQLLHCCRFQFAFGWLF